jgi:uncharacterized RDD family membrane protein YckC
MPGQPAAPYEPPPMPPMPAPPRANPDDARNRRVLAALADSFVLTLGVVAMVALMDDGERLNFGAWWIVGGVIGFLYYFAPQALFGQTLGKALCDVRVVNEWQQPPSVGKIFVRTLLLWVDNPLVAVIAINVTGKGRRQRVGDLAAGTYVVRASQTQLARNPEGPIAAIAVAVALLPVALVMSPAHEAITSPDVAWRVRHTANEYLTAAVRGDTATACRLMAPGEKRAIVARGLDTYVAAAGDADCRRFAAPFLKRDAKKYAAAGGPPIEIGRYGHSTFALSGAQNVVGMTQQGDNWRVDQAAGVKAGFMKGCNQPTAAHIGDRACGCIFDELRGRGYESEGQLNRMAQAIMAGAVPDDLRAAAQTCVAARP